MFGLEQRPRGWQYGIAAACVGAATLVNFLGGETFGRSAPFLFYYPAIAAAGAVGGTGPALLATLLSALAVVGVSISPMGSGPPEPYGETALRVGTFVAFGLVISYLNRIVGIRDQVRRYEAQFMSEAEPRFRLLVQEIKDYAIFILDPDGIVRTWNVGAERIKGYTAAEIVGQHFSKFYPPADAAWKPRRELEQAARLGRYEDEGWRVRKDGSSFWANVVVTALRAPTGTLVGFAKVTRDLTERKAQEEALKLELQMRARAEESLKERAAELARSNAELERFAYVASHDLQEPLRMVISFMDLLEDHCRGQLDAEATEFIRFAVDGAARMKQLIQDLLAYSRVSREPTAVAPTDAGVVLDEVIANLDLTLGERGAVVTHNPLPIVLVDRSQLVQLLQNLVANAVKFRGADVPRVHVSARPDGGAWLFSVHDNGIGISPEHRERIFEIFERLHDRRKYPGTGIGLAICKRIVERHGGRIWVESQPGAGATFLFTLPGVDASGASNTSGASNASGSDTSAMPGRRVDYESVAGSR